MPSITVRNIKNKAIEAQVIDMSSGKGILIRPVEIVTPVIGHPRDRAPITWQIGAQRTNHDEDFVIDTIRSFTA